MISMRVQFQNILQDHNKLQAIMLMIQNNLNPAVAQHPEELITYGGNGAVFQNWAQYLITMKIPGHNDG